MNIILASIKHLPELIEGRVCVFSENGTYKLLKPTQYTKIEDNFDPMDYSILIHTKYPECIVYSEEAEKEHFLINKRYKELFIVPKDKVLDTYRVGDKIHLFSRRGIYRIIAINEDTIEITCNKWRYEERTYMIVHKKDFKCLAGGIDNYAE